MNEQPILNLTEAMNYPTLQRWIGVQYLKDTEISSHYGEVHISKAYDMIVFIDKTTAIRSIPKIIHNHNKRLLKEYYNIMKHPISNIKTHPLENNILEWHFIIIGTCGPYKDGYYHGILEFPTDFPMKPPSIKILTPNGRFETNTRLCLTMSDYHPESWNPSWTVETLLIGLQSFMYQESERSIGSIHCSYEERVTFAKNSIEFNKKNAIYIELFYKDTTIDILDKAPLEIEEDVCRFCFNPENLISPCECKGSNKWLHLDCLKQWQKSVLLTQSTHPKYQTNIDKVCNICLTLFNIKSKSRHQSIVEYTGKEIINLLQIGHFLVSSEEASEANLELIEKHPEIKKRLIHWTKTIFLIVKKINGVIAVNLTLKIDNPLKSIDRSPFRQDKGTCSPLKVWNEEYSEMSTLYYIEYTHFIGGPCYPDKPFAIIKLLNNEQDMINSLNVTQINNYIFGKLSNVVHFAKIRFQRTQIKSKLKIFWGYAGWDKTQILAEIAKRSWGVCINYYSKWETAIKHSKVAKKSEYSKY